MDWAAGVEAALQSQPPDVQRYVTNELLLCPIDFRYWAERYCTISHDAGRLTPFKFRRAQETLLAQFAALEESEFPLKAGKVAVIVVKTRRAGATAFGEAAAAHGYLLRPQAKALVGSDTPKGTLELNHVQNRIYENLPPWMRPRMDGKVKGEHLRFPVLDSELTYTFGDAKTPIQGVRQDFVHLTEVPTWMYITTISDDILPAFLSSNVPTSFMFLEGTGKSDTGSGIIYQRMYEQAAQGKGVFRPVFLGWFAIPEIHSMPARGVVFDAASDEMAARVRREHGVELTRDQLAWWQVTRQQFEAEKRLQSFLQEYPTSADEAWQTGLQSAISVETRDRVRRQARTPEVTLKWNGGPKFVPAPEWKAGDSPLQHLFIYELPRPGFTYVVGVDGSHGDPEFDAEAWTRGERDPSGVEVLRVATPGSPPEQVASFMGYVHPKYELPFIVEHLGKTYADATNHGYPALLACEVNAGSPSAQTQQELIDRGYPNFYVWKRPNKVGGGVTNAIGWDTTPQSRPWITSGLVKDIEDGTLKVNAVATIEQMKTFVRIRTDSGRVRLDHAPGYHDDSLFALGIALFVAGQPQAVAAAKEAWEVSQKPREDRPAEDLQHLGMRWVPGAGWQVITAAVARGQEEEAEWLDGDGLSGGLSPFWH